MHSPTIPTLDSAAGLANRAGVARSVVLRLLVTGHLVPDAFVIGLGGCELAPVFMPDKAVTVLRYQKISRRYQTGPRPTSKIPNLASGPEHRSRNRAPSEHCSAAQHDNDSASTIK